MSLNEDVPIQIPIQNTDIAQPIPNKFKTKSYVLRAAKTYREKHPEKVKEYREKYKKDKEEKDINLLPNDKLTKKQLLIKMTKLEEKIKSLEINK